MLNEYWKSVIGYEGLYEVSNYGRVKSLKGKKERILKPYSTNTNYQIITFSKKNKRKRFSIHRLVAINFIDNPHNKPQVNHIDGDKLNNYYKNLEWCTASENIQHAYNNRLMDNVIKETSKNNKTYHSKKVYCPELNQEFESTKEVERQLNISAAHISKCCNGKRKSIGKHPITKEKLTWKYIKK